ncbi:MAG: DUF1934 domain-containing protein [Clostridia bacterium]|nr:DUF1934 domain-containing protein [Clostridia bacterium]
MKNAIIHIKMTNRDRMSGEDAVTELTTTGSIDGTQDDLRIGYAETDDAMRGCLTTMRIERQQLATMTRTGAYAAALTIEQDRRHNCLYATPFGEMMMGFYGKRVQCSLSETTAQVLLDYAIDLNTSPFADVSMQIDVKTKEE